VKSTAKVMTICTVTHIVTRTLRQLIFGSKNGIVRLDGVTDVTGVTDLPANVETAVVSVQIFFA